MSNFLLDLRNTNLREPTETGITSHQELNKAARQTLLDIYDDRGSKAFKLSDGAMANVGLAKDGQVYLHVYGTNTSTTVAIRPDGQLYANQSTHESEPVRDPQSGSVIFREKPSLTIPVPDELARSYVASARAATIPNK